MPWARRRTLGGLVAVALLCIPVVALRRRSAASRTAAVCHPNLSRLRGDQGQEIVIVGTVPLDLDGSCGRLVSEVLDAVKPDMVLVEGPWQSGVLALFRSGKWAHEGQVYERNPNWTDIGSASAVQMVQSEKPKGWFRLRGPAAPEPRSSYVPVKVHSWARHLLDHVGGDVATALQAAAAAGVSVRFLGPDEVLFQGPVQVGMLAKQATQELLEEEHRRKAQLPNGDIDMALMRAEARVREEHGRWTKDARKEARRERQQLRERGYDQVLSTVLEKLEEWARRDVEIIQKALSPVAGVNDPPKKAVVIVSAVRLVSVEEAMVAGGYEQLSTCA